MAALKYTEIATKLTTKWLSEFTYSQAQVDVQRSLNAPRWAIDNITTPHLSSTQENIVWYLKALDNNPTAAEAKKIRIALRKLGFKLSEA